MSRLLQGLQKVSKPLDAGAGVDAAFSQRVSDLKSKGNMVSERRAVLFAIFD